MRGLLLRALIPVEGITRPPTLSLPYLRSALGIASNALTYRRVSKPQNQRHLDEALSPTHVAHCWSLSGRH